MIFAEDSWPIVIELVAFMAFMAFVLWLFSRD